MEKSMANGNVSDLKQIVSALPPDMFGVGYNAAQRQGDLSLLDFWWGKSCLVSFSHH